MQNPHATTSLKPGGRDVNIAKYLSQMNIGHHCWKWISPNLGVERIVLRDVFLASIFLAYVEPKLFFSLSCGEISSAAPSSSISQHLLPQHKLPLSQLIHINPFQDECSSSAPCWSWCNYTIAIAIDDSLCTNHGVYFCGFDGGQWTRRGCRITLLDKHFSLPLYRRKCQQLEWKGVMVMQVAW